MRRVPHGVKSQTFSGSLRRSSFESFPLGMTTSPSLPVSQPQPLPANIPSIQPGGGVCYRLELAWGEWRRRYLKLFRPRYVRRMRELRQGDPSGCPHEVLDPRDLKYFRNQGNCRWPAEYDQFAWRERLPFARWGLAELQIFAYPLLAATVVLALTAWYLAPLPAIGLGLVVYFFRDPRRNVPPAPGLVVSPADGRIAEITQVEHDEFIGGPAVRIGIFLSIFNVHINRLPCSARVLQLRYSPGEYLNALRPESALRNENMWIGCESTEPPQYRFAVRQIAGAIARRIVCDLRPGESLDRGHKFGMIKLGSRTELILPADDRLQIETTVGMRVQAGATVLASWSST